MLIVAILHGNKNTLMSRMIDFECWLPANKDENKRAINAMILI
jgi:hypothetical protein